MDDKLFEEMLQEITAMTAEEYWSLYREAEKSEEFSNFVAVPLADIPIVNFPQPFYFRDEISTLPNICSGTIYNGDDSWLKVA